MFSETNKDVLEQYLHPPSRIQRHGQKPDNLQVQIVNYDYDYDQQLPMSKEPTRSNLDAHQQTNG